jgi:hypothetical protein
MIDEGGSMAGYSVDPSFYPSFGLMITSPFPRISSNFFGTLILSVSKRYTYGYYSEDFPGSDGTVYQEMHMHNLLLRSELLFGYTFGKGKVSPSLFVGPVAEYLLDDDSRIDYDTVTDWVVISESESFDSDTSLRGGFTAGTSLIYELSPSLTLQVKASYSILSGDNIFKGVNSINLSTGIIF